MRNLNAPENWLGWLRACLGDPGNPIRLPRPVDDGRGPKSRARPTAVLGMLTGQDVKALGAVACCWALYAGSDHNGQAAALVAIRALLRGMQSKCHMFARELIAQSMDWNDRARVWPMVMDPPPSGPGTSLAESLMGVGEALREMAAEERATPPPGRGFGFMGAGEMADRVGGATLSRARAITHARELRTVTVSKTAPATWLCNSCLAVVEGTEEIADREGHAPCPECADEVLCACRDCLELVPVVQGLPTMDERVRACHSAGYGFKLKQAARG